MKENKNVSRRLKRWLIDKNDDVMFTTRRNACRKSAKGFPVLYDKRVNVFKEKDSVQNAREKLAESLVLQKMVVLLKQVATENILKIVILKKLMPCSVSELRTKY